MRGITRKINSWYFVIYTSSKIVEISFGFGSFVVLLALFNIFDSKKS